MPSTEFGTSADQDQRLSRLQWSQLVRLIDLLGLDRSLFSQFSPPAQHLLSFQDATIVAETRPATIEIALQWASPARRPPLQKALDLLDLTAENADPGTSEWLLEIASQIELRGITLGSLKAALKEAQGKRLGDSLETPTAWKGTDSASLEKITGNQNSLLPIHFLELALRRAEAVAKIETPVGSGSGFIVAGNLLVTNAHVLPDLATAKSGKAVFNFQKSSDGLDLTPIRVDLDPETKFLSSPSSEHDLSIVALSEPPDGRWKEIPLAPITARKDERVCIIQHPGGDQKHLGLYHNMVTYADDDIVQYLTDTLPGSSGSPVFNHAWELVAVHHAGGWLTEPGQKEKLFRNEGISVAHLLALLAQT